ncbi:hypothetical protein CVT26_012719, partial [Gymnopilus dilepis]
MTDLTVLVSPIPLYPDAGGSSIFSSLRSTRSRGNIRSVMVTLEREIDQEEEESRQERTRGRERPEEAASSKTNPNRPGDSAGSESEPESLVNSPTTSASSPTAAFPSLSSNSAFTFPSTIAAPRPRKPQREPPTTTDPNLLSPPINTWKSRPPPTRPRHRPTRSQSAPPERRTPPSAGGVGIGAGENVSPTLQHFGSTTALVPTTGAAFGEHYNQPPLLLASRNPKRSSASFNSLTKQSTQGGELIRPPPPLLRPTTFWRKTRRSGVTGASYSPSSHLIRRSTYVAAGLTFDAPVHDLRVIRATAASPDRDDIPDQGTTARVYLDDLDAWLVPRQATTQAPQPAPAQGTPGPPVPVSWPANPPIVVSIISDSSTSASAPTPSANGNGSTTSLSSPSPSSPPSSTLTSSSQSTSTSASASTSTTPKAVPSIRLSLFTFVPAIGGLGLLLLLVVAWLIYGCVTRKPKKGIHGRMFDLDRDGEELVCGPPYSRFLNHGNGHNGHEPDFEYRLGDLEREGRSGYGLGLKEYPGDEREDEEEHLLRPPKKMTRHVSRWPSFTSPPTFNPTTGFHLPRQYSHEGEGAEDSVPLMAIPPALSHSRAGTSKTRSTAHSKSQSRSQASHTSRTPQRPAWKSKHSSSSTATNTTITGPAKSKSSNSHPGPRPPPPSHHPSTNTFSTQLYSDSDSDDHKEFHDQAHDQSALLTAPWESLRHKSIKRGILEQVKKGKEKEAKWMDSIRSGGQFLAALASG